MAGVLKISEAASIAVHTVVLLAGDPAEPHSARGIASRLGVSADHLSKVLQRLTKVGLVVPTRGRNGGYALTKPGASATLLDIIESIDGSFTVRQCSAAGGTPHDGGNCILQELLDTAHARVIRTLKDATVCDLAARSGDATVTSRIIEGVGVADAPSAQARRRAG